MTIYSISTDAGNTWSTVGNVWTRSSEDSGNTWTVVSRLTSDVINPPSSDGLDFFGIKQIYPTKVGGRVWNAPLGEGQTRTLRSGQRDGTNDLKPLGSGTYTITPSSAELKMVGDAPRAYVYDEGRQKLFENVEITAYYKSVATTSGISTGYQGFEMGVRGQHELAGTNARVYYSRHSLNGVWWRLKEDVHPKSYDVNVKSGVAFTKNIWYGMKHIVRNMGNGHVMIESYRDETDGKNGGTWTKMFSFEDSNGSWSGLPVYNSKTPNCACHSQFVRTDNAADFRVKKWSIRELNPLP